jgi:hypothetical protein
LVAGVAVPQQTSQVPVVLAVAALQTGLQLKVLEQLGKVTQERKVITTVEAFGLVAVVAVRGLWERQQLLVLVELAALV